MQTDLKKLVDAGPDAVLQKLNPEVASKIAVIEEGIRKITGEDDRRAAFRGGQGAALLLALMPSAPYTHLSPWRLQ